MPRLIKGASYRRDAHEQHLTREVRTPDDSYAPQHGDDVQNHDESWEEAARCGRVLDPEGIQALRLLHELQDQEQEQAGVEISSATEAELIALNDLLRIIEPLTAELATLRRERDAERTCRLSLEEDVGILNRKIDQLRRELEQAKAQIEKDKARLDSGARTERLKQ